MFGISKTAVTCSKARATCAEAHRARKCPGVPRSVDAVPARRVVGHASNVNVSGTGAVELLDEEFQCLQVRVSRFPHAPRWLVAFVPFPNTSSLRVGDTAHRRGFPPALFATFGHVLLQYSLSTLVRPARRAELLQAVPLHCCCRMLLHCCYLHRLAQVRYHAARGPVGCGVSGSNATTESMPSSCDFAAVCDGMVCAACL